MTNTEQKIWDIVHNWCNGQSIEISDFAKRALMDQINGLLELTVQPSTEIVPIGTKVRVTKRSMFICCDIGDVVTIVFYDPKEPILPYKCEKENGLKQWLPRDVFEPV